METRFKMILAMLFLFLGTAMAQTSVTGTVVSGDDGEPIIGASVRVVGAQGGAVTDVNGKFSLTLPDGRRQLRVSSVGMATQDVTVRGNSVRVVLSSDRKDLDEVIVVAYGTAKKSAFTGSAAVVKSEDITKTAQANALSALTGKVAGVQINSASGMPGQESFNIRIRGISSIMAGNGPLLIVDGSPYDGDFNSINPGDIESMTVLKDAASAALYGSRGANGVVLITTKGGKGGTSSITVDAKWGGNSRAIPDYEYISSPAKYYETYYSGLYNYAQNRLGYDAGKAYQWANNNLISGQYGLKYNVYNVPDGQNMIGTDGTLNPNATLGRVFSYGGNEYTLLPDNWADAAYRNSLRQEYTVTAAASNDKGSFYGSANYLKNEGITVGSDYTRFAGRMKADYQMKPWLKLMGNFSYTHYNSNYMDSDGKSGDSGNLFSTRLIGPIYPLYIRDGKGNIITNSLTGMPSYDYGDGDVIGITRPYLSASNPLSDAYLQTNEIEGNTFNAVGAAEIRFLKDFKFTTTNTVLVDEARQTNLSQPYFGQQADLGGQVAKYHSRTWSYNYQQLLNYHHQFGLHEVEAMVGHEYYRKRYYLLDAFKSKIFSIRNTELSGAILDGSADSYTTDYNTEGFFARAQYNYDNKYFGSVSFRRDASSYFHPDHRWGNFWSFGGAWIISKEKWFNAPWVDELKLKASYGEQGNDNLPYTYLYTDRYTIGNSNGNISLTPSSIKGNEDITWEKSGNFNTGVEFSLFRGRLTGSVEFFYRRTTDMIAYFTLPPSYGYTGYYDNVGNMSNRGFELELDGVILRNKDFEWGANLNLTTYRNRITSMPAENKTQIVDGVGGYSSSNQFYGEGQPIYTWYMAKYAGVDKETGEALYWKDITETVKDADGNPVLDENGNVKTKVVGQETTTNGSEATMHLCGTALPDAYGGFGTRFAYKGFDLSADFTFQLGGKVYDQGYAQVMDLTAGSQFHTDLLKAWTPENTNTDVPRLQVDDTYMAYSSDRFLKSASYLSLQNINFGYTLPSGVTKKFGVNKLRLYLTAANLWIWSARQGLDPRQSLSGNISSDYYSPIRSISGGVSVTF